MDSVKREDNSEWTFISLNQPCLKERSSSAYCVNPWFGLDIVEITGPQFFTVLANRHGTTVSVNIAYFESARPSTRHSVHGSHRRLFNEPVQAQHGRLDKH